MSEEIKPVIEFPKWVLAHEGRVVRQKIEGLPENVTVKGFDQCHVNRVNGEVTVLVNDEAEEAAAMSEQKAPEEVKPEVGENKPVEIIPEPKPGV